MFNNLGWQREDAMQRTYLITGLVSLFDMARVLSGIDIEQFVKDEIVIDIDLNPILKF